MRETGLAHAKVNISLDIVSKMEGGYHKVKMVMQTVSLADEITIECIPGEDAITVDAGLPFLPRDERNIAAKAASAFFKHNGISGYDTRITMKKNIPVCAGLGGGSADGACVLRLLDKMFQTKMGRKKLESVGLGFGSDVPFCIDGGTSLAEGRGEILTDLPALPKCTILICKPPFSCKTPVLFGRVQCDKIRARPDTEGIIRALAQANLSGVARRMYNVFEDVLTKERKQVQDIKNIMLDNAVLGTVMTGSGPSVIGIFENSFSARNSFEHLKKSYAECYLSETVERLGCL